MTKTFLTVFLRHGVDRHWWTFKLVK